MNVKVKELQGKLAKSARRTMMIATLCGDDRFVNKVIGWELQKTYESIDKWAFFWKEAGIDDEMRGDIANAAIVSLKDATRGKDSVERAKNFVEALTGLLFEDKDNLSEDDMCNAVTQLRLIGRAVLPEGKYVDPAYVRDDGTGNEKIKSFSSRNKKTFQWHLALKVANTTIKDADTEDGKKALDKKEAEQAANILEFVTTDPELSKMVCSFGKQFSDWIAEQLFGLKPEVVEVIGTVPGDDRKKTVMLFNQFAVWLKDNDPNGYVKYLAESTGTTEEIAESDAFSTSYTDHKNDQTSDQSSKQKDILEDDSEGEQETEEPVYGRRFCVQDYTGIVGTSILGATSIVGSFLWRQAALEKIRANHTEENTVNP